MMSDDEDLRDDEKLSVPTLINRVIAVLSSIYFLSYLLYESYHFTSRNFISAGIHEYLLFWVTCQHLVYFILALLISKKKESRSTFLPTFFTGLTFPLSQLIVILWITNSMCNECIHSRDLYNILPHHMHGVTVSEQFFHQKSIAISRNLMKFFPALFTLRYCLIWNVVLLLGTNIGQSQENSITYSSTHFLGVILRICHLHGTILQWTMDLPRAASRAESIYEVSLHAPLSGDGSCMFCILIQNNGICHSRWWSVGSCLFRKKKDGETGSGSDRNDQCQSDRTVWHK